ncbi:DUF6922 domain-containing protein [Desertivirga brevis]|uniref:DUF6922 domain-containing protein n=1 Tax=Desertivirga brevis TaxID=2810310 RepID=UPI001A974CB1|nr:hypothetical protein [Pedobacter sp. SYSU D00873]
MREPVNIAKHFPKHLFWDVDPSSLNTQRDKDFIIPRALYATTPATFEEDITKLEGFYSSEEIVAELKFTKERISNQVCELVAKRYHIETFSRFFRRKQ